MNDSISGYGPTGGSWATNGPALDDLTAAVRQAKDHYPWVFVSPDRHATYEILYDVLGAVRDGAVRDAGVTCVVLWDGVQ